MLQTRPPSSPLTDPTQERRQENQQGVRRSISSTGGGLPRRVDSELMSDIPNSTAAIVQTRALPTQQVQQNVRPPAKPSPPALSVDEGFAWIAKKKAGNYAVLEGDENLVSLYERDHVSGVPCCPRPTNSCA